ncbi:hypothetical protein VB773_22240 [Haloarculaceae archaeon H-GB2-1]|nr:hypothetical protein [Haloarculaceae archaeon H-GB11]MEA5410020.1 hypothetical protein [Haloarculaceae archaeon H-GB2-1]
MTALPVTTLQFRSYGLSTPAPSNRSSPSTSRCGTATTVPEWFAVAFR